METIAARLGFDLVSHRLELFGRKREAAEAPRKVARAGAAADRPSAGAAGKTAR